jgi:mono/diheme cytochrome c family protein
MIRRAITCAGLLAACDNRQAFEEPVPGLERMLDQPRADRYGETPVFADGRTMRTPPLDTVPRERAALGDRRVTTGRDGDDYVTAIPLPVTRELLERGRLRFDIVCATCHGVLGDGRSVVAEKMQRRKPESLYEKRVRDLSAGKLFEIVSTGYGFMPGYAATLEPGDRWAIIAYIDALRLSRGVAVSALPPELQRDLAKETR